MSLNPADDEAYSIQHYVIKIVSDLQQVLGYSGNHDKGPFPIEKIKYDIITSIACLKKPILSILDLKYHQDTFLRLHLPFTQNMGMASTHNNILQ
jgi:hypothetical protein